MVWRKVLAVLLVVVATSPAWGAADPLGSVTSASASSIRATNLSEGSTVFSGDVISVATNGATQVALTGGGQLEVLGNSLVRLNNLDKKIQISVDRGQAFFHSAGNNGISALVADATVRSATGADTSALIQSLSDTHAIITAEKGALLVTTAHDGKSYTVNEGEAADLSAMPDPQQNGGAIPAGKSAPPMLAPSKKVMIWTVVILAAGATAAAIWLVLHENKLSQSQLINEISPARLN